MQNKTLNFKQQDFSGLFEAIDNKGKISGYASVFNEVDQQGDIITKGAFANIDINKVKFLWQHDSNNPIGKITKLIEDHYGLYIEVDMILDVKLAQEAHALIKSGAISGLSIGFQPAKYHFDENENRIIEEIDLWEISLVTFPANQSAGITDLKNHIPELGILSDLLDDAITKLSPLTN